ncbi:hypothetical protein [Alteriqipengyuania lutimaris]|nr:hypothetical protein [Alteriqipengyuania lutimaris]MBB3034692.1 chromosome segregation ATPase [Alteriqipengyuania lutimaris]
MKNLPLLTIAASSLLAVGACANNSNAPLTTGERISERGSQIGQYGDAWSAGQDDVVQGERAIQKSNETIERARSQIADANEALAKAEDRLREAQEDKENAERQVADGNDQMDRAEESYEEVRDGPSAGNSPSDEIQGD